MRHLQPPDITAATVFAACVGMVRDADLQQRLRAITDEITAAETGYRERAGGGRTHEHPEEEAVGAVTRQEMEKLYTDRMAKGKSAGRPYYDRIRLAARHGICPFCGERPVKTLDHYLAKSRYPRFVVTPINLVPSCSDCNKDKLDDTYPTSDALPIHPYFDDVDGFVWLKARVAEAQPPAVLFAADPPPEIDAVLRQRICNHFGKLGLAGLYSTKAAEELSQVTVYLDRLRQSAGAAAVRSHLREQALSRRALVRNTWQAALHDALADSDWFCEGGYRA